MKFELGAYSFGAAGKNPEGETVSTAHAVRNLLEQIQLAEQAGLDFYGVGEHHTPSMPVSSPAAVISAAAAGRGSSTDSFPLFGFELDDYDRLYADKLGLLLAVNDSAQVSWDSPLRPPLKDAWVVPRPEQPIPIWLGTGGNPGSTIRAGQAGLPVSYGILSGAPQRWGEQGALYREAARQAGADESRLAISVASHGFVGRDGRAAKDLFFRHEQAAYAAFGRFPARSWADAAPNYSPGGMTFAGDPEEIAERIIDLNQHLGHIRHFLQMDIGGMPQAEVLKSIELLGTEVAPRVRAELGRTA